MDIKHLDIGISHIDNIFHISDIHIRTLKRHKEYREVFKNMFDTIERYRTSGSIAVVTGDIVHSKLDMSPELVQMLIEFFNAFTLPTIVILGNHDMNVNNMHRIDAISPILNVTTNPYIHFIRDNAVYQIAQCTFNHMPVDIPPADYIRANEFDSA
jgi:predicted MPP superfamily phosphohydrolase